MNFENNGFKDREFGKWFIENFPSLCSSTEGIKKEDLYDEKKEIKLWIVGYSHEIPLDSWDRLFALFIIDKHPEAIGKPYGEADKYLQEEFGIGYGSEGTLAYDNYERDWLTCEAAWDEMMNVAKKGKEAVMEDSYDDGGWFGAS